MPKGPSGQKHSAALVLALLVIASPAVAQEQKQAPAKAGKPIIYYGPGLDSFSPPSPVIIGGTAAAPPPARPETPKPAPKKAPGSA